MLEDPNSQEPSTRYQDQPDRGPVFVPGCRVCGRQDETLRLVRYPFVVSLLFVTYRRAFAGLWCRRHARTRHFLAALITSLVGWIGLPFGFIYSPITLWQLAKGGDQPPQENASLLRGLANHWLGKGEAATAQRCLEASLFFEDDPDAREKLRRSYSTNSLIKPGAAAGNSPLRLFGIFVLLLAGAAAGGLTGLLDWVVSSLATPLFAQDSTMIGVFLSWIPLVAIGVMTILGLVQLLGWTLQMGRIRSKALGAGTALITSLLLIYGFLQGRAIGYFIDTLRFGVFTQTDESWLVTGLAVLLRGGAAEFLHIWQDKQTNGMIYLILLVCLGFFAFLALEQAASKITGWQARLAGLQLPDLDEIPAAGFAGWLALVILPLGIALLAWLLPQRGLADFMQAMYATEDGLTWLDQGNPARAVIELQRAVALRPGDAFFHDQLGWAYLDGEQAQDALVEFQTAIAIRPGDFIAQVGEGDAYLALNQYGQAAQAFEQFVASYPDEPMGFLQLGYARLVNAEIAAALAAFQRAVSLNPQEKMALEGLGRTYLVEGDARQAEQAFRKALEIDPKSYTAQVGLGRVYFAQFHYDQAVAQLEATQKENPDETEAGYSLAFGYYARGEFDKAAQQLKAILEKEPESQAAHAFLAVVYYDLDQPELMQQSAKNAERAADKDGFGWYMQGLYAYMLRDFPRAESALRKAVELQPFDSGNYLQLANVLAYQGKYTEAWQACERLLALAAASTDGHLCRSQVLVEQGELDQALIELQAAERINPSDMSVLSDLSYLYLMQGRNQQALETAQQILPVFPYDQQVFVVAALAVYEQDPQQALSFAQQAVKLAPKGDLAHYALGMALLKAGQAEQAAGELRSFLDLYWERAGAAAYKAQAEAALQALK